ncbi:MAG TPA: ABC transporter ATP-binding protein [Candidatus Atribacteria bacterium]|nr:ABC transporter ATP-binding protein [Candidatus Atribacteria bacterium]
MEKQNSAFNRIWRYLRPYKNYVIGAFLMALFGAGFNLAIPWLVKGTIDNALVGKDNRLLLLISLGVVVLFFFKGLFSYLQNLWISYSGFRAITCLRSELYQHLYFLPASFFRDNPAGEVVSRLTNDVAMLQNLFSNAFVNLFMDFFIFSGSIILLFFIHWKLALFSVAVLPLVGFSVDYLGKRIKGVSHLLQKRVAALTSLIERAVAGMKVFQSYMTGNYETEKFEMENEANFALAMKQAQAKALLTPLVELVSACGVIAVLLYGGREVIQGHLTAGGLIAFLGYLVTAASPLSRFSSSFQIFQQSLASAERLFDFLDLPLWGREEEGEKEITSLQEGIRFKNVSFSYQEEKVLKNFNLEIKKGEKVGIVGHSGAGKTTLINLLLRFYDPEEGSIEIDGIDIRELTFSSLRNLMGVVLQDTLVLGGTIKENILYGNLDATLEEVRLASVRAHAHEFIVHLEKGYDTEVGEGGARFSGGQKQRIAIARALLKDPPILIFDEATSNLDPESERYILDTIANVGKDKIVIVVAHSLSMVKDLDRIILVEDGEVKGDGTHEELLQSSFYYRRLFGIENFDKVL